MSRTNFISSHTCKAVRVVGLSTALANARDLADWLGIKQVTCPADLCVSTATGGAHLKYSVCGAGGSVQLPPFGPARPPGGPHPRVPRSALLPPHGQHEQANLPRYVHGGSTVGSAG